LFSPEETFVAPILLWLIMFLCLVISVVKYLMGLILRVSFPGAKIRKDYTWQPTVSVLMPCFNEGRTVYQTIESISKSNYPNDSFEVIAQDDCSVDDSYEWMLKAQRDFTNIPIRVGRNDFNCGKARTVCNALQHSTAEIIISIDSDCIFHPDAIRELTACFAEPGIGSVGGRVGVSNPNDNVITAIQTIIYYSAFELYKIPKTGPAASAASADASSPFAASCCLRSSRPSAAATGSAFRSIRAKTAFSLIRRCCAATAPTSTTTPSAGPPSPTSSRSSSSSSFAGAQHRARFLLHPANPAAARLGSCTPTPSSRWCSRRWGAIVALLVVSPCSPPIRWPGPVPAPLVVYLGIAAVLSWAIKKYSARETLQHPWPSALTLHGRRQFALHHAPRALHHGLRRLGHAHQGTT
jgi:hypothetical protein